MTGGIRPQLLSLTAAAKHLGIGAERLRRIIKSGQGPRVWSPDGHRKMFAVRALDEWAAGRDDQGAVA